MKKYKVSYKHIVSVYEVNAIDKNETEELAHELYLEDGGDYDFIEDIITEKIRVKK